MTKGKLASTSKEKPKLPDEWKELFLWIKSTETVEDFVKCLVRKVLELNNQEQESFYEHYKKTEFREKIRTIVMEKRYEKINHRLSTDIMRPFYDKLGIKNLKSFLDRLRSPPTPPQSQESKS